MTTIKQGENVVLHLALRSADDQPVPLVALRAMEVTAKQKNRSFKKWSYTQGAAVPADMRVYDGLVAVELQAPITAKMKGAVEFHCAPTYADEDYFATHGEVDVVCFENLLEVIPC